MKCNAPLTDEQIEALLDGYTDPALTDHIANCASCAERFTQAETFETALKKRLYRWDCPSSDTLADYDMNLLTASEHHRVTKHLETCPYCQSEIQDLRTFLNDERQPQAYATSATTNPKTRYESIAHINRQAPSTALRGKISGPIMAQTDSGITLFLEIQSEATQTALVGQIVAEYQQDWEGALVKVFQDGQMQGAGKVSDMGDFRCKLADTTPITLEISAENKQTIIVENLVFND